MEIGPISLARIGKLRKAAARQGFVVDESGALLISGRSSIRYLSGFTGSAGYLVVGSSFATLYTDGRYTTQARQQATAAEVVITERDPLPTIAEDISVMGSIWQNGGPDPKAYPGAQAS